LPWSSEMSHHRRRRPWSHKLPPSTKTTPNSMSEAIAPGGGPFSRATSAVCSSSPPCSTGLWITAVRHDLRTKVPRRHSGVHGTPLERRQRPWRRRVGGISLMYRFEFCDLLGDDLRP
jgi:hypothetical protein